MDSDISKIISKIMENPKLIEEIKALGGEGNTAEKPPEVEIPPKKTESVMADTYEENTSKIRRRQLLTALKPYLSDERSKAIDSMITISEVLGFARKK